MIEYNLKLEKIDLHWNKIRFYGGQALIKALEQNQKIRHIDLSWNSLGTGKPGEFGEGFGNVINHPRFYHVNISYNDLVWKDCELIGNAIKDNHTLYGLHMNGNQASVDLYGYVCHEKMLNETKT